MLEQTESKTVLPVFKVVGYDIVYCRVSTDDQVSNTSLPDQEAKCRDYLERLGLDNVLVFKDDYSGFELNRPELKRVIDLMKQGKVRSFIALRVDRICRRTGILDELRERYFMPLGIQVYTLDLGEWQWTPAHIIIQNQLCIMGEYWGRILVEVLQNGRKKHVLNGNVITAGHAPLGLKEVVDYDTRGKRTGAHFEFNEGETPIIFRIFGDFVDNGLSLAGLANKLNSDKVPTYTQLREFTPFKEKQTERSKSEHKWRPGTIRQILRNTVYDGRWYFGKTRTITKILDNGDKLKTKVRTDQNLIEVKLPVALIPHEVWQAAQDKLDRNREEKRGRQPKHEYLLSKRIACECGYKMTAQAKDGGRYLYYRCPSVNKDLANGCVIGYVRADLVDALAWHWLYKLLKDKDELRTRIDNYQDEVDKVIASTQEKLMYLDNSLKKKHATHEAMLSSLFKLPELAQAKTLTMITQVEEEIKEQNSERSEIMASLDEIEKVVDIIGAYLGVFGEPEKVLGDSYNPEILTGDEPDTYEKKLRYISDFDLRVTILSSEKMRVSCRIGSEILSLLDVTSLDSVQKAQGFYLSFSDVLSIDLSTLSIFEQGAIA